MGQIQLITSLILIGLFSVAVIGFGLGFANDNNAPVSIANDPEITRLYDQTGGNLSGFDSSSEGQYQSIIQTTTTSGGTAPTSGPFAVTPFNAIGVAKNIMKIGYVKIFGTGSGFGIFLTTFIGLIVFMLGLYVYKTLRGAPD